MIQRIRDILILILTLPVLGPLFILVVIASFLFHRNNIFFSQKRLGINQRQFSLFKFRSMIVNAQSQGSGLYSFADDNRITPFGKFIRRTSLDELPQLINVLKGDMSFVGPRPAVVGELDDEEGLPSDAEDRFNVKPGLTGWAQIHGRDNLTWQQKIFYDLDYVSFTPVKRFFIDIYIILYTPLYLLNFTATYEKRD
jgi:undecaprenyl phosphate N,N'-diacetylbacillosamine 1-phosphate transferase